MAIETNSNNPKILLIGDVNRAFSDADVIARLPYEVQTNMPDGISAAAKKHFEIIAVVMSGSSTKLSSALKTLRQTNPNAKILLLAQMHQEPTAKQLATSASNDKHPAVDYLICPLTTDTFHESVTQTPGQITASATTAALEHKTKTKIKHLEKLATEDELTGLKNRRYIWEFSRQIVRRATREKGRVTLLIFDIDDFKHYNDVYGHMAGDQVLKQAALLMQRCCRRHDVVGRIGGDEFAVVFWDDTGRKTSGSGTERRSSLADHPNEVIFIAKRFRQELEKTEFPLLGPEGKGVLTISGGLASLGRDGSTAQQLLQAADRALLEAKKSGKNRIYLVGKPQNDISDIKQHKQS